MAGFDVTLLEGRNRIGGRIHTIDLNEGKMDLGAAWIHGLGPDADGIDGWEG